MNATESLAALNSLIALPDTSGTGEGDANGPASKAAIIAIAEGAGLPVNGYVPGDPGERTLEVMGRAFAKWSVVVCQAGRAPFLALSTDPGDVDDFGTPDQSFDQTPRPGWLSAQGASASGVTRGEQTYATSFVTIRNDGATTTDPFMAGQLVMEYTTASRTDLSTPTYKTTADPSIYVGIGGTLTLGPGGVATLPVQAQQIGEYGSAPTNAIDLVVTQSYGTLVVVSSTAAIGRERQPRPEYIEDVLLAPNKLAPGGPGEAYRFAMRRTRRGDPLPRFDGSGAVTITQAYVSPDSADNEVTIYYGGPAGAVDDIDVSSANANIIGAQILDPVTGEDHNPDPIGCLPDTVLLLPLTSDPNISPAGTPGGESCVNTPIFVNYLVKVRAKSVAGGATPGTYGVPWHASRAYHVGQTTQNGVRLYIVTGAGTSAGSGGPTGTGSGITDGGVTWDYVQPVSANTDATRALFTAIATDLGAYMLSTGIGGLDQTAGAGFVYTADLPGVVRDAAPGMYDPIVSVPGTSSTAITLGHIAVAGTIAGLVQVIA